MLFCPKCGNSVEKADNFCRSCGTPLNESAQPAQSVQWEYCEIELAWVKDGGWFGHDESAFVARAVGPSGKYNADNSPNIYGKWYANEYDSDTKQALNTLIKDLSAKNWELLPARGEKLVQL